MRLGTLGELVAPNGRTGRIYWREEGTATAVYQMYGDDDIRHEATLYGRQDIRLERVAAFIGYLEEEARAAEETHAST